jgi:hypothetical protein
MADTSYNAGYAPYANWSIRQAPVPQSVHNVPASIAASSQVQSNLIATEGFSQIAVGVTASQAGTLSVQRYLDAGGTVVQGAALQTALVAGTAANLDIMDGKLFAAFRVTLTNSGGSTSNLTNFALLLQAADSATGDSAADGSTSVTTGGTAQTLFGGVTPANGFGVYNPDPSNDLWISDTTTAAINGQGSIRVVANGGGYETPVGYKPAGAVSVIGSATGQKITARRW